MSFGKWRGATLACLVSAILGWASVGVSKGGDLHSIPREVMAYDYTTGGPYYAPPIPYGHYAKDKLGAVAKAIGCVTCQLHGLCGLGGCLNNHHCGDGKCAHGQGGQGGCGHGQGAGCGSAGHGAGCGHGLFGHGNGNAAFDPSHGHGHHGGQFVSNGQVGSSGQLLAQNPAPIIASPQGSCGFNGCGFAGAHSHSGAGNGGHGSHLGNALGKIRCGLCKGQGAGCGVCGGSGMADPCGACGGRGCDGCRGLGCHGLGSGCNGLCGKLGALGAKAHSKLAGLFGHGNKIEYFVGPGGPVPITPGYVPYIVTTRSPRDFFSFAPMNPNDIYP